MIGREGWVVLLRPDAHTEAMRLHPVRPRRVIGAAIAVSVLAALAAGLTGCASRPSGTGNAAPAEPMPATDPAAEPSATRQLIGQGTVLQVGDTDPKFCVGGVLESYPPQCSGPVLLNWNWAEAEYEETASDVTWGSYAVHGTWDGIAFTQTQPAIPLALYDPMAVVDPRLDESQPGKTDPAELERIAAEISGPEALGLGSGPETFSPPPPNGPWTSFITNGYVFVLVTFDDGTTQRLVDDRWGPGVVAVQSALRPVG